MFAKFDEIPSMIFEDIKKTKRYGHTDGRSVDRSDNVKTVYPPTNTVYGGHKYSIFFGQNVRIFVKDSHIFPTKKTTMYMIIWLLYA